MSVPGKAKVNPPSLPYNPLNNTQMPASFIRTLGACASPAGASARLSVLIFHRVLPRTDAFNPGNPDSALFTERMELLARCFHVLPLAEAAHRLRNGTLPARAVCITFDDGYADNYHIALPILRRYDLPATFFIASGFLDGGCMWNDALIEAVRSTALSTLDLTPSGLGSYSLTTADERRVTIKQLLARLKYLPQNERSARVAEILHSTGTEAPTDLMMTGSEVRALHAAGMEIGGHTISHPILARLPDVAAAHEIMEGLRQLEAIIHAPVRLFAYPNGRPGLDYTEAHVAICKKTRLLAAVSTERGAATKQSDLYQLPRFTPWDKNPLRFGLRLLMNCRRRPALFV